jgi:hypothetical protein
MSLEGLDNVLREIDAQIKDIDGATLDGLLDAGLQVQRSAQQRLRPSVVTGNLRASAYTRKSGQFVRLDPSAIEPEKNVSDPSGDIEGVEVGFTAKYAIFAHENLEGNRAPKFLENAVSENRDGILEIIRKRAERK